MFQAESIHEPMPIPKKFFETEEKRERLRIRADQLIETIKDEKPQTLLFLDRGGRPIYWMLREAWQARGRDEKLPTVCFMDVGPIKKALRDNPEFDWKNLPLDAELTGLMLKLYKGGTGTVLVVDDYEGSGRTKNLAMSILQHHFPDLPIIVHSFLTDMDCILFRPPDKRKANWIGPWLPWNTDKSLALMEPFDEKEIKITRKPLTDTAARQGGLALRREIKEIFRKSHSI